MWSGSQTTQKIRGQPWPQYSSSFVVPKHPCTCIYWQEIISVRHIQQGHPLESLFPFLSNISTESIHWTTLLCTPWSFALLQHRRLPGSLSHQPARSNSITWCFLLRMMQRDPQALSATTRVSVGVHMWAVSLAGTSPTSALMVHTLIPWLNWVYVWAAI